VSSERSGGSEVLVAGQTGQTGLSVWARRGTRSRILPAN
jgi:hypothetical protein